MSPRVLFEQDLETLKNKVSEMGEHAEISYDHMLYGIRENKEDILKTLLDTDHKLVDMQRSIEAMCLSLLTRQQPVASDLRQVSSALKMISDMERIGDQASDIAEICGYIQNREAKSRVHIRDMAEATMKMVTKSIDSYVKRDLKIAKEVVLYDDVVDDLFGKVKQELIGLLGQSGADEALGEFCIDMLMIAKYCERIGDHATNIAEWVEYSITGIHLK